MHVSFLFLCAFQRRLCHSRKSTRKRVKRVFTRLVKCGTAEAGRGRLEDVAVLGHHQDGDEIDDGQRQELRLFRLLHVAVNDRSQAVHVEILQQAVHVADGPAEAR